MRIAGFVTAGLLALSTAAPLAAAPIELITNGGFESGNTGFSSDFADAGTGAANGAFQYSIPDGVSATG